MKINEVYTAYVAWNNGGKRNYYKIRNWSLSVLVKQSYVDIRRLISLDKAKVKFKLIENLSLTDIKN